jgi:hypothetical protein
MSKAKRRTLDPLEADFNNLRKGRLRDGRRVRTEEDLKQWTYQYLDNFASEIGQQDVPLDVFPQFTRVMCEWAENTCGYSNDGDRENAEAVEQAIADLTACLKRIRARPPVKELPFPPAALH